MTGAATVATSAWRRAFSSLLLRRSLALLLLVAAAATLWWVAARADSPPPLLTRLALVLPDDASDDDPQVLAWRDAAAEIGFPMDLVRASQLLREGNNLRDAALILPDTLHRRMNDALLARVTRLVQDGARLMLVFDAGVNDMNGRYHPQQSRLSGLAGVRFALYGGLGEGMLREQVAWVDPDALPLLHMPPGKLMRQGSERPLTSAQPAPASTEQLAVVGYHYGRLRYPVFATDGKYTGRRLMHGDGDSLVAGVQRLGQGEVLFVNMPLTYLKLRTDGLFLHQFLRFFAQNMAQLPQLSPMPEARGALVMNWHIDSGAAVPAMERLAQLGAFEQGPYSVHLTAGPDVDVPGDGLGMDLPHNTNMQQWVRRFADRGDEVGGHGGWIHNEFGRLISTQNPARSTQLIERNSEAIWTASGKPVREYSAPTGNHPAWVTPWLRARGVRAYYFTGDIGMAPTRSYQDGKRGPTDVWAFPVLSYGSYAAFEEAAAKQVGEADISAWLKDVSDYCADNRTVRLVYFHPPGIALYPQAFRQWLEHTKQLVGTERLRWTTMAQQADFANNRLQVQWQVHAVTGGLQLVATDADSLAHMTWLLPTQRYAQPKVLEGTAQVSRDGVYWRVIAGPAARLVLGLAVAAPGASLASAQAAPAASTLPSTL